MTTTSCPKLPHAGAVLFHTNLLLSISMRTHYVLQYSWVLRLPDCIVTNDTAPDFPASRARMRAGGKIRSFHLPAFYFSLLGLSLLFAPSPCLCLCNYPQCCRGLPLLKRKATVLPRSEVPMRDAITPCIDTEALPNFVAMHARQLYSPTHPQSLHFAYCALRPRCSIQQ